VKQSGAGYRKMNTMLKQNRTEMWVLLLFIFKLWKITKRATKNCATIILNLKVKIQNVTISVTGG